MKFSDLKDYCPPKLYKRLLNASLSDSWPLIRRGDGTLVGTQAERIATWNALRGRSNDDSS